MIKAAIFDLDGTLLDRDGSLRRFVDDQYDRLSERLGPVPKKLYIARFTELDQRGYRPKKTVYKELTDEFGITGLSHEDLLIDYRAHFPRHCVPFPHLYNMLEKLQKTGLKLGMITNGPGSHQMNSIRALKIETYFDTILVSESEGVKKPDPVIFMRALERLDVRAAESVFVGDHPEKDVEAAGQTGMRTIWKQDSQWGQANADAVIESLADIPDMISRLDNKVRPNI